MSATYDPTLPTDRDHVRFLIGDTVVATAQLQDAEIDAVIADETATGEALKYYAAATLLSILQVRWAAASKGLVEKRVSKLTLRWGGSSGSGQSTIDDRICWLRRRGAWLSSSRPRVLRVLGLALATMLAGLNAQAQSSIGGIAARAFPVQLTAAQLPTANGSQGLRIVTNALSAASCTIGGGTVKLLCIDNGAWTPLTGGGGGGSDDQTAAEVPITDIGAYYAGSDVESALQQIGADTRWTDARPPTSTLAHVSTHENGGSDELSVAGLSGLLADPQTPVSHVHSAADTTSGAFADARISAGSVTQHESALEGVLDIPDLQGVATPTQLGTGTPTSSTYLRGDGAWTALPADDDVPESGDFGALILTGPVTSSGLATTITLNSLTSDMVAFNYAGSASEGGPATTALALNADPSPCADDLYVVDIAADGTLTCEAGGASGVTGPVSSTDRHLAVWNGTAGTALSDSLPYVQANGAFVTPFEVFISPSQNSNSKLWLRNNGDIYVVSDSNIGWSDNTNNSHDGGDTRLSRLSAGVVMIQDALRLNPRSSPPVTCGSSSTQGVLYTDDSGALCWCDGVSWQKLSGGGACA